MAYVYSSGLLSSEQIRDAHLQVAENYRKWHAKIKSFDEQRRISLLEATARSVYDKIGLNRIVIGNRAAIPTSRKHLAEIISEKTGQNINGNSIISPLLEVRDDVQILLPNFRGYSFGGKSAY